MKKLLTAMVTSMPLAAMSADLTVYTYDAFAADWGPAPTIETAFEAQCGCDIEFVGADSSLALLRKVQLEGPSSPADIILGLDTNSMEMARETNLLRRPSGTRAICRCRLTGPSRLLCPSIIQFLLLCIRRIV